MGTKTKLTLKQFIKRFGYFIVAGCLVVGIVLAVILTNIGNKTPNNNLNTELPNDDTPVASVALSFGLPIDGAAVLKNFSERALAYSITLNQWESHKAVDFISESSDQVNAIAEGTVKEIYSNYKDGTVMVIEHRDGYKSVYKSLAADVSVAVGDKVSLGQAIARTSDSGANEKADSLHLHLELYKNDALVNPLDYLDMSEK